MDLDKFDPNNDIDEDDNSRDHSTSHHIEFIENTHNQNRIDVKAMRNGLSNSQLSSKIENKLVGSDSESVSLNEIQRKLQSLVLEKKKKNAIKSMLHKSIHLFKGILLKTQSLQ